MFTPSTVFSERLKHDAVEVKERKRTRSWVRGCRRGGGMTVAANRFLYWKELSGKLAGKRVRERVRNVGVEERSQEG